MKRTAMCVMLIFAVGAAFAQDTASKAKGKMIHLDLKNFEGEGTSMEATLPLSLIASVKPQIEQALGELQSGSNVNFREIWNAVKDSGPTEFVDINSEEAKIKVSTTETHLRIYVDHKREAATFNVTLPLALGQALFGDPEKALDYDSIIEALLSMEGHDLVNIDSDMMKGRVWID